MRKNNIFKNKAISGQASFFVLIFIVVFIIILLIFTLWILNRHPKAKKQETIAADKISQELPATLQEFDSLIDNLTEAIDIYSAKDDGPVLDNLSKMIDGLTDFMNAKPIKDIKPFAEKFDYMAEELKEFVQTHDLQDADLEKEKLIRELNNLNKYIKKYPVDDVDLFMKKLDDIINMLKKKTLNDKDAKIESSSPPPHKTPNAKKTDFVSSVKNKKSINQDSSTKIIKFVSKNADIDLHSKNLKFPIGDKITSDKVIEEKVTEQDGIFGKRLCLRNYRTSGTSTSINSVNMMINQMVIKLVKLNSYNGTADLDITIPGKGLRQFKDMEEGTRLPFEYGDKTYYCALLKVVGSKCADIAVYERNQDL